MRSLSDYNPAVVFVYFILVTLPPMLYMNPVLIAESLCGAILFYLIRGKARGARTHVVFLLMFIIMALINPLFNHNGVTVLFYSGDNPVTLEALLYGIAASASVISVIYWFRSFCEIMESDRLLYVFGKISPKFALLLSMTLRYIPLFNRRIKAIQSSQRGIGLYASDNIPDSIRGGMRVFSVMITWALEDGIITADSMSARGYGTTHRTSYSLYRIRKCDIIFSVITLLFFSFTAAVSLTSAIDFNFYPKISALPREVSAISAYISYAALSLLPSALEINEVIKWKYLLSKI